MSDQTVALGQAPTPFSFDPPEQIPPNAPQPGTGEYAQRIRRVQAAFVPLGTAVETNLAQAVTIGVTLLGGEGFGFETSAPVREQTRTIFPPRRLAAR